MSEKCKAFYEDSDRVDGIFIS